MLSQSALEEREWLGLRFIRAAFEANRGVAQVRVPWSSVEESEFDRTERVLFLATLLADNPHVLLRAVREGGSAGGGEPSLPTALREMELLRAGLDHLRQRTNHLLSELDALGHAIATHRERTGEAADPDPSCG